MAGDVIASLLIKLGLDARDVETGVKQTQGAFSGIGTGAKVAFGVAAGAAAVGFGLMAKGAAEMETAQGRFQAATGGSREEAARFADDMNGLVGSAATVGTSFEAISAAGINVAQQLRVTGEEGKALTKDFLAFAKVTSQDAAGAVTAFDDILDSWGLTADDATGIMDKLIVSMQKFGTPIKDAQVTLSALAPAMKAANLEIDDGIALLNLFGTKGIDANTASAAFAKSLTKVKSPEELQRLIDDIAGTEDAFERSQKAAALFGARAGAKLANALAGADLDDFKISVDEAAGATEEAAESLVTTSDRFRMFFDRVGSGLRGLGADFGPLVSGIAGLGTLLAPMGGKLSRALAGIWGKVGGSLVVKVAIGAAGAAAGLIYEGAAFVASKLLAAGVAAWAFITTPMAAAAGAAGAASGAAYAAGVGAALGGPAVLAIAATAGAGAGAAFLGSAAGGGFLAAIAKLLPLGLQGALAPIALATTWDTTNVPFQATKRPDGSVWLGQKQLLGPQDIARPVSEGVSAQLHMGTMAGIEDLVSTGALQGQAAFDRWAWTLTNSSAISSIASAMGSVANRVIQGGQPVIDAFGDVFDEAVFEITRGFGNVKQALEGGAGIVSPEKRLENMRHRLDLASKNLRTAISVGDPIGIARWTDGVARASAVLDHFKGATGKTRREVARELDAMGLHSARVFGGMKRDTGQKSEDARRKAVREFKGIVSDLQGIDLTGVGARMIQTWIAGIHSMRSAVRAAGEAAAGWLGQFFHGSVVPKVGPLAGFDNMGANMVGAWLMNIDRQEPRVRRSGRRLAAALQPSLSPAGAGAMAGGRMGGGVTVNLTINGMYGGDGNLRRLDREIKQAVELGLRERDR